MTASVFPGAQDNDANLIRVVEGDSAIPADHNNLVDAIEAIEAVVQPWADPAAGATGEILTRTGTAPFMAWSSAGSAGQLQVIEAITLGAPSLTLHFPTIPGAFNHLFYRLVGACSDVAGQQQVMQQFNGDSGANYRIGLLGAVNGVFNGGFDYGANFGCPGYVTGDGEAAGACGICEVWIPFYSSSVFWKIAQARSVQFSASGVNSVQQFLHDSQWLSTAAITDILLSLVGGGHFAAGTQAFLYGIG